MVLRAETLQVRAAGNLIGELREMAERRILEQDGKDENSLQSSEGKQNLLLFAKLPQLVCRDMHTCGSGLSEVEAEYKVVQHEQKQLISNLFCL